MLAVNLFFSIFLLTLDWKIVNFQTILYIAVGLNFVFLTDMIASFVVLGFKNALRGKVTLYLEILIQIFNLWYLIRYLSHNDFRNNLV